MILTNYWKWLDGVLTINPYINDGNYTVDLGMKDINGDSISSTFASDDPSRPWQTRSFENGGIRFGSGSASVNADDYAMSSDVTASISNLNVTINSSGTDAGLDRTISISGMNSSESSITITEAGYYINNYNYGQNETYKVLMAKTKLNTPLTVPSGSSFLIDLEWVES